MKVPLWQETWCKFLSSCVIENHLENFLQILKKVAHLIMFVEKSYLIILMTIVAQFFFVAAQPSFQNNKEKINTRLVTYSSALKTKSKLIFTFNIFNLHV